MLVISVITRVPGFIVICIILIEIDRSDSQPTTVTCESRCNYTAYAADAECTNRRLTIIPSATGICRGAQMFDCSYNAITSLDGSSFVGYWQVRYLHLEENQIASIDSGTFLPLKNSLRQVNISSNRLTSLVDGTFVNMTRLQYLFLSYNQISDISPDAFQGMGRLSKLYIGNNNLAMVDANIFKAMPNLREVNLRNNRFVVFDVTFITNVGALQKIFIQGNAIEIITGDVSTVQSSLFLINLSANRINDFDCSKFETLEGLTDVYLGDNSLQSLQSCHRTQMPTLHLDNNQLHCDCGLQELARWSRMHPDSPSLPTCWTPENLRGMEVREAVTDINCSDDITSTIQNGHLEEISPEEHTSLLSKSLTDQKLTKTLSTETILKTTVSVNIPVGVTDESWRLKDKMAYEKKDSFLSLNIPVYVIVVGIGSSSIIVIILLCCTIQRCCCLRSSEEEKQTPKREPAYSDVESEQDVVKTVTVQNTTRCWCPCYASCSREEEESESKKVSPYLTINHEYEKVFNPSSGRYPRQLSGGSDASDTRMVRISSDRCSLPICTTTGVYNPGMDVNRCTCTCDCPDHTSQYSYGSYTDSCSDESYQMENQLNEMCDCPHRGRADPHCGEEECERMLQVNIELPPPYTSTGAPCSHGRGLPQLPSLPGRAQEESVYIQHNQV